MRNNPILDSVIGGLVWLERIERALLAIADALESNKKEP
jgi:hypothetical protein